MRAVKGISALGLAAALAGCGAVSDTTGALSGGFSPDGRYALTDNERTLTCVRMANEKQKLVADMKGQLANAKLEQTTAAPTAIGFLKRTFGGAGAGLAALQIFDKKSAMVDAYDADMKSRNCPADKDAAEIASVRADVAAFRVGQ